MTQNIDELRKRILFTEIGEGEIAYSYSMDHHNTNDTEYGNCVDSIPKNVISRGKDAVLEYALKKVIEIEENFEREKRIQKRVKENPIIITTEYKDGTPLEGVIKSVGDYHWYVDVEIRSPIWEKTFFRSGKLNYFDGDNISQELIDYCKKVLVELYEQSLHPIKSMIKDLNAE